MTQINKHTRPATKEDFKIGITLIDSEGYGFTILRQYDLGIWEARGTEGQGDKVVYEDEARFYTVPATDLATDRINFLNDCRKLINQLHG